MRVNLLFWIILRLRCVFRCVCARFCWQTFKYNSVHGVKVSTPECFNEHDIIAFCQCLTWIPFKHSSSFTVWLADEIITMWEKRDFGLWVTALGVLSVTQLNLHILYIPEFDTEKRNLCTFITYFQVILFTRAVSLHELRFFSKMNKYHLYLLSKTLFVFLTFERSITAVFTAAQRPWSFFMLEIGSILVSIEWRVSTAQMRDRVSEKLQHTVKWDGWCVPSVIISDSCLWGVVADRWGEEGTEPEGRLAIYWSISVPTPNLYGLELWPVTKRMWFEMSFLRRVSGLSYSTDRVRSSDQSLFASMHRSRLRLGIKMEIYISASRHSL